MHGNNNWMDRYYNSKNSLTDLTYIGSDAYNENPNYICEFCNAALIEKKDDVAHLGLRITK
jgi:hypothetical protein